MKAVPWAVAFRNLNEWRERGSTVAFGRAGEVEEHGETTSIFIGETTSVIEADESSGVVTLLGMEPLSLVGASFRFSTFEDSPFAEADLRHWQFESQLEATFPDGRALVFAREWDVE
jgi:hypothetical protein